MLRKKPYVFICAICWSVFRYKKICTIYQRNLKLARIFWGEKGALLLDILTWFV